MNTFKHWTPSWEEAHASVVQFTALSPASSKRYCNRVTIFFVKKYYLKNWKIKTKFFDDFIYFQMLLGRCSTSPGCRECLPLNVPRWRLSFQCPSTIAGRSPRRDKRSNWVSSLFEDTWLAREMIATEMRIDRMAAIFWKNNLGFNSKSILLHRSAEFLIVRPSVILIRSMQCFLLAACHILPKILKNGKEISQII